MILLELESVGDSESGNNVPPPPAADPAFTPRRLYIKPADLETHGRTAGCPGCFGSKTRRDGSLAPQNHTEECRRRITKAIRESGGAGSRRVEAADSRIVEEILSREADQLAEPIPSSSSGANQSRGNASEEPQTARRPGRPRKERDKAQGGDQEEESAKKRRVAEDEQPRGTTRPMSSA